MRRKKRNIWFLGLGVLSFATLIYLILSYPPDYRFMIYELRFMIFPIFFILLFSSLFFTFSFTLNNKRRGLFIGGFAVIYLVLRMNNLTHPLFLILLLILSISLELFYIKRG